MSATLNLGNGQWATKKGSTLAYNSENNNYKPLPFTFDRASSATRVNKAGLIETVGAGEPRIDFKDNTKGALKLEPTRSNLWTNSNLSASISLDGLTRTLNQSVSPSGDSDATLFKETATTGTHRFYRLDIPSTSTDFSMSFFAKKNGINIIRIVAQGGTKFADFDLSLGIVNAENGVNSSVIEDYGNGWYRCIINVTASGWVGLYALNDSSQNSYLGNVSKGVYLYGASLEQGSYATSYIPTSGSAVTRIADTTSQTVPDGVIGQTEGTIFTEINIKSTESIGVYSGWKIDGTSGNQIAFITYPNGRIQATVFDSGSLVVNINDNNYGLTSGVHKIAFAYKQNDYILYVDGSIVGSDTSATVPVVKDFDISYLNLGSLKYNETKLYNKRLSNSELQALTQV